MDFVGFDIGWLRGREALLALPEGAFEQVLAACERANAAPATVALVARALSLLDSGSNELGATPEQLGAAMGADAPLFPLLVLFARLPWLIAHYESHALPEAVLRDTLSDIGIWMKVALRLTGAWGLREYGWLAMHFQAKLYRLGRLQFVYQPSHSPAMAFRDARGRVVALSPGGQRVRPDGQIDGTNDIFSPDAWTASYDETGESVTGHPIDPVGRILKRRIALARGDWQPLHAPGMPVLDMHIAEGQPLSHAEAGRSLKLAEAFYAKYFPEQTYCAYTCHSWLLGWPLTKIMSADSNIVAFQNEFYRVPTLDGDFQTYERSFGQKPADLTTAPRDTRLRAALLDWELAGNRVFGASGFIPAPSADWGAAKTHWLPEL